MDVCDARFQNAWSAGPDDTAFQGKAADFTLPTSLGDWTFSDNWTGCDSYLFFVRKHGSTHDGFGWNGQAWSSPVTEMLQESHENVHWVVLSDAATQGQADGDTMDMRTRLDGV